jgi:hypothetical protein
MKVNNAMFNSFWLPVILSGSLYMKDKVPTSSIEGYQIRRERLQHVLHFYVLFKSADLFLANFTHIVEFGAGERCDAIPIACLTHCTHI